MKLIIILSRYGLFVIKCTHVPRYVFAPVCFVPYHLAVTHSEENEKRCRPRLLGRSVYASCYLDPLSASRDPLRLETRFVGKTSHALTNAGQRKGDSRRYLLSPGRYPSLIKCVPRSTTLSAVDYGLSASCEAIYFHLHLRLPNRQGASSRVLFIQGAYYLIKPCSTHPEKDPFLLGRLKDSISVLG